MRRGRKVKWRIRETPPSIEFPNGVPEEQVEVWYEPDELDLMAALRASMDKAKGAERARLLNEIDTIHECKALLGAVLIPNVKGT